jgi:hypothetical protein
VQSLMNGGGADLAQALDKLAPQVSHTEASDVVVKEVHSSPAARPR